MTQKLRELCVPVRGKKKTRREIDPKKSADLFHRLGLIYMRREPDKISLIQSAGLLNAALVRKPDNKEQIKQDLIKLHRIVLKHADADNGNANLEEKASFVKEKFQSLRSNTRKDLENVKQLVDINNVRAEMKKIEKMTQIQNCISSEYKAIMVELSRHCEKIMGNPPCKYALIGMGSLARKEISPYSDFEHAIVLEGISEKNSRLLEYFRWFSVIFHIIILNLQETIVPNLHIPVLNDKSQHFGDWFFDDVTPSGISFDGMMPHACKFPLGRQNPTKNKPFTTELIGSVVEMLNYLSEEEDLKNGYHLSDILSQTCFVFGDETVYNSFADGVKTHYKKKSDKALKEEVKQQVEEDLNKFSIRRNTSKIKFSKNKINIKSYVYRAISLFISALRKLYRISESSSFDVISELERVGNFSSFGSRKLRLALMVACEMRLRLCMNSGSQHGHVRTLQCESQKKDSMDFLHLVGKPSTLNLLQIGYCLQAKVADLIDFDETEEFLQVDLFNIFLCYKLNFHQAVRRLFRNVTLEDPYETDAVQRFDFDGSLRQMEEVTQIVNTRSTRAKNYVLSSKISTQTKKNGEDFFYMGKYCFDLDFSENAKEFFRYALEVFMKISQKINKDLNVGLCYYSMGLCWKKIAKVQSI